VPEQILKDEDILCVFQIFQNAAPVQKIRYSGQKVFFFCDLSKKAAAYILRQPDKVIPNY
jgi:hypothetical protein